jgi:hypothetical protein
MKLLYALYCIISLMVPTFSLGLQPVDLGTSSNYAILTKSGITTVPQSTIVGDIASSPIAATGMTGFSLFVPTDSNNQYSKSSQVTGKVWAANYAVPTPSTLTVAVSDMETAYTAAAGVSNTDASRKNIDLSMGDLTTGVYTFTTNINLTRDITFKGTSTDVFLIQTTGNVNVHAGVEMLMVGTSIENIYWQVAGLVHALAGSKLAGVFLIKTQAIFITGSSLRGRLLCQTACVLQKATIVAPGGAPGGSRGQPSRINSNDEVVSQVSSAVKYVPLMSSLASTILLCFYW